MTMMPMRAVFNKNVQSPCLDCYSRTVECHGKCDDYKGYRSRLDNTNKIIRENKEKSYTWLNSIKSRRP